jgi:hypothetical protein
MLVDVEQWVDGEVDREAASQAVGAELGELLEVVWRVYGKRRRQQRAGTMGLGRELLEMLG